MPARDNRVALSLADQGGEETGPNGQVFEPRGVRLPWSH